ncbi:MAG: CcmD family protein [Oscillochloridaceae bacterium umkhey_bin13]
MNNFLEAGVAIYVAMAVALSVWLGIFIYLWRIDAHARRMRRELEQLQQREPEQPAPPATLTRVNAAASTSEPETVER